MLNSTGTPVQWKGGQDGPWGTGGPFFPLKRPKSSSGGRTGSKIKRWKAIFSVWLDGEWSNSTRNQFSTCFCQSMPFFRPFLLWISHWDGFFFAQRPGSREGWLKKGMEHNHSLISAQKYQAFKTARPLQFFFKVKSALCVMQCNSHNSPATSHHHAPTK